MAADSTTEPISIVDLFAGCGGFTQGFHSLLTAGSGKPAFRSVAAVEHDIAAASTYALNFAEEAGGIDHIHAGDIETWFPEELGIQAEVILGGPPCQGFSGLGKEDADDPRNQLWREYLRIVNTIKPKIFVIENVDRFLRSPEFALLHAATEKPDGDLRDYRLVEFSVLNSADFGVPQARRRAIVIAVRRDLQGLAELRYPPRTHAKNAVAGDSLLTGTEILQPWVSVGPEVFAKTPYWALTTSLPAGRCAPLGKSLPGIFETTDLHVGRRPVELSVRRYMSIPPGGNRHDIPDELSTPNWIAHRTGSHDVMGRMYWDRPSVTIRTEFYKPEKGRYLHPTAHRPITHYEAALIQGFPPEFKWCGSKVQIGRQIGNAVPVGLSRAIAGVIHQALRG
ncbi:DNA cytosine methyltransferase [Streptomyces netropsis]|uniref:Cytosine-specific methyltransferase n=1 Tax=Streptomyces netropsis TaxID=55404 RepID=A0A7W7PE67_STRNE|nr:DNA cytosine methyltransferase [Streptomyces netropsis]MBB4887511.1 DNA (cytosine-5)-methyltransferase 1 [Streptomyces netropsis]GGR35264.1 cytosine-specific methyltransferase [Streptomyces netropsis]